MSLDFTFDLDLDRLRTGVTDITPEALGVAMEHVRGVAAELTPIETGRLVGSAQVHVDGNQASLTYDGPYARYQHERLDLRHEHGQAKYLEQPMITEKDKVLDIVANHVERAIQ